MLEKKFFTSLSLFTAGLSLVGLLLQLAISNLIFPHTWFLLAYFFAITLLSHFIMLKATKSKEPIDTYNATMGSTALRLFLGLVIVITYIYVFKTHTFNFAITFFVLYGLFTTFEIRSLLRQIKKED